jgi:hypothetical protein
MRPRFHERLDYETIILIRKSGFEVHLLKPKRTRSRTFASLKVRTGNLLENNHSCLLRPTGMSGLYRRLEWIYLLNTQKQK